MKRPALLNALALALSAALGALGASAMPSDAPVCPEAVACPVCPVLDVAADPIDTDEPAPE